MKSRNIFRTLLALVVLLFLLGVEFPKPYLFDNNYIAGVPTVETESISEFNTVLGREVAVVATATNWLVAANYEPFTPDGRYPAYGMLYEDPAGSNNLEFFGFRGPYAGDGVFGHFLVMFSYENEMHLVLMSGSLPEKYWDGASDTIEEDLLAFLTGYNPGQIRQLWPLTDEQFEQLRKQLSILPLRLPRPGEGTA